MRYFPKIKYDDGLDTLAMAVGLINNTIQGDSRQQSEILKRIARPSLGMSLQDLFMYGGRRVVDSCGLFKFRGPRSF